MQPTDNQYFSGGVFKENEKIIIKYSSVNQLFTIFAPVYFGFLCGVPKRGV